MRKIVQNLEDGNATCYEFWNNNTITVITKKENEKFKCVIGWKFNEWHKEAMFSKLENKYFTYNSCRITEVHNLYEAMKKHKNKSYNKKLLIKALLKVYHDISQEIEFQQEFPF